MPRFCFYATALTESEKFLYVLSYFFSYRIKCENCKKFVKCENTSLHYPKFRGHIPSTSYLPLTTSILCPTLLYQKNDSNEQNSLLPSLYASSHISFFIFRSELHRPQDLSPKKSIKNPLYLY